MNGLIRQASDGTGGNEPTWLVSPPLQPRKRACVCVWVGVHVDISLQPPIKLFHQVLAVRQREQFVERELGSEREATPSHSQAEPSREERHASRILPLHLVCCMAGGGAL